MQVCKSDSKEICFGRKLFGAKKEIFEILALDFYEENFEGHF